MQVLTAIPVDEVKKHPDGRVDLLGLYEDIYFDRVPFTFDALSLFVDLRFEPEDQGRRHVLEFRIADEDGTLIHETTRARFEVPAGDALPRSTAQLDMAFFDVTFHRFGPHAIEIWLGDTLLRTVSLYVLPSEPPAGGG